jgi:CheY-like chemotaxis protein
VLTHLLSQVIQRITPPYLRVTLQEHEGDFRVVLTYPTRTASAELPIEPLIDQMMRQIRWKTQHRAADGEQQLILLPMQKGSLLLVIDDNEGLVDLLQRYFTGNAYRVVAVPNNEQGLGMVQRLLPDAIILDLMMPNMDGWEVLQRLRTHPDTRRVPVVICSVINDPELAYSLGASRFVPKPVNREALLAALGELGV